MIVKREYVPFRQLVNNDPETSELILKTFEKSYKNKTNNDNQDIYEYLMGKSLSERKMEWGMADIGELIETFEHLDKVSPYDNHLNYSDVLEIELIKRDSNGITVKLLTYFDDFYWVVSVERIGKGETEDGETVE